MARSQRPPAWILCTFTLILSSPPSAQAQKKKAADKWRTDPYTSGAPAALKKAGYTSLGPFMIGDDHDSRAIHKIVPEAKILWVETAHFRLGSSMTTITAPEGSGPRRQLAAELKQLRRKLPRVKKKPRRLNRWLRLHLYAQRLETIHQRFSKAVGNPPPTDKNPLRVILFQKAANLSRYAAMTGRTNRGKPTPLYLSLGGQASQLFATSPEIAYSQDNPDHRLHTHIMFNVAQMLFRQWHPNGYQVPTWIKEGLANTFVHNFDDESHHFSGVKNFSRSMKVPKKWAIYARNLAVNGGASPTSKLLALKDASTFSIFDQISAWSRMDVLRRTQPAKKLAELLLGIDVPYGAKTDVVAVQKAALKKHLGLSPTELDRQWKQTVLKRYPKK